MVPDALSPTLGVVWQPAGANPVIGDGTCPGWHCVAATDPALARTADGSLAVWFTTVGIEPDGSGFTSALDIGRAIGSDGDTITFAIAPDVAVTSSPTAMPAWDAYSETWSVRYNATARTWTAWYLGYSAEGFVGAALGQTQSLDADGTMWTRPAMPIYQPTAGGWDAALISGPVAMQGPDGIDRLYYTGVGSGGASIGLLTSTDGATWTPEPTNPVFPHSASGWDSTIVEQTVRYYAGRYWMFYSGYDGALADTTRIAIGLATSSDGIHWDRYAGNPVLSPGAPGAWNDLRVLAPDVLVDDDGSFLMVAYGQATGDPTNNEPGRIGVWRSR